MGGWACFRLFSADSMAQVPKMENRIPTPKNKPIITCGGHSLILNQTLFPKFFLLFVDYTPISGRIPFHFQEEITKVCPLLRFPFGSGTKPGAHLRYRSCILEGSLKILESFVLACMGI